MRTVLHVGLIAFVAVSLLAGPALAAPDPCDSPGSNCCPPDATHTTYYCKGNLICNTTSIDHRQVCERPQEQDGGTSEGIALQNPLGVSTVEGAIAKVLDILKTVGAPVAVIMVIIGGFQMLFSAGDPDKFKSGQKTILYSAIGYAIIFLADGIATLITNALS